ncbi:MAG: DegT/DnrJ/EryC1/StrS family aminotransferase [Candidatus Omnitrophota bacterium]
MPGYIYRCDLSKHYRRHGKEIMKAMAKVAASGVYTLGMEVGLFEEEFAGYIGRNYGVGVASGTDALILALKAAGIKSGDEVITTVYAPTPVPTAIVLAGGVPVFTDIDESNCLMAADRIAKKITSRTKFIIAVHLFGSVCDMTSIMRLARKRRLTVIEDCAQAHGSAFAGRKAGTFGALACFSFYPTKNLGAYGDGGMVLTDSEKDNRVLRALRNYGKEKNPFDSETPGYNSRLDELQAAVLRVKLRRLERDNRRRVSLVAVYRKALKGLPIRFPGLYPGSTSNYHVLNVLCRSCRDRLSVYLEKSGIQTNVYYPTPLYRMRAFARYVRSRERFPVSERISRQALALPLYPELDEDTVRYITVKIRKFFENG